MNLLIPTLHAAIYWLFAGIFAITWLHKMQYRLQFTGILQKYQVMPVAMVTPVTYLLILMEAIVVLSCLAWLPAGLQLGSILVLIYSGGIIVNLLRGRHSIDCGCGGTPVPLSGWLIVRNFCLLLLAGSVLLFPAAGVDQAGTNNPSLTLMVLAGAFTIILVAGYESLNQVLANQGIHRRLWLNAGEH